MIGWKAALYLENGHLFLGNGFGAKTTRGGEAIFNTGLSGYQEVFTDPSYRRQVVVMTVAHIGNTGINPEDMESDRVYLEAVVARSYTEVPSNWRATMTLDAYLEKGNVPGISNVDTRALTQILRDEGAQRAVLFPTELSDKVAVEKEAKEKIKTVPGMAGLELVSDVSCKKPYWFNDGATAKNGTIVAYDFGVKANILRHFAGHGFQVRVVPYNTTAAEVRKENPKAIVLSNGPGDPGEVKNTVAEIQKVIGEIPIFAVCMGHQLLARALGASTYKLKFGHHGCNHPVQDLRTKKVLITSQNHGFSVRGEELKGDGLEVTHLSLNDNTVEGFASPKLKLASVQFHPEAAPGPREAQHLFDDFIRGHIR